MPNEFKLALASLIEKNKIYTVLHSDFSHILLLHEQDDVFSFVHLAGHKKLLNETCDDPHVKIKEQSYLCLETFLNMKNDHGSSVEAFSVFVDTVFQKNYDKGLPYSFAFSGSFNNQGEWIAPEPKDGKGFTCATFILMLFASFGYKIINYDSWAKREEDCDWEKNVVAYFDRNNIDPVHTQAMKDLIGSLRYRPDEVSVASAIYNPPTPSNYDYIQQNIHLLKQIISIEPTD
ncbi:hypothetical protein [Seleniivibrio woodruffii]|uniref:hypothetical protein n=1 Tax=Seleniivibrio woodruffii TaxID=1078050 RepID=UPI00240A1A79|nr:hypothetical protein [Seleniivibrio woodruffii]